MQFTISFETAGLTLLLGVITVLYVLHMHTSKTSPPLLLLPLLQEIIHERVTADGLRRGQRLLISSVIVITIKITTANMPLYSFF